MRQIITVLFGATALSIASVAGVLAADISLKAPVAAAPSWTGFYFGANVGGGWGNPGSDLRGNIIGAFGPPLEPAGYTTRTRGFIGGAQAGYNYQSGALVLGVEADIQYADIKGTTATPSTFIPSFIDFAHYTESQRIDWLGTLRGRVGFLPTSSVLLYATGGLAYGGVRATSLFMYDTPPFATYTGASSQTKVGWTAGGGVEWALDRAWSVKAEYLYFDLGSIEVIGRQPGNNGFWTITDQKVTGQMARVGVNYRFGGPVVARY